MVTNTKADFEARLLKIERSINTDPVKAFSELNDLKQSAKNEEERSMLYCDVLLGRCLQRQGKTAEAYEIILAATTKLSLLDAPRETAMGYHFMSQVCLLRQDTQTSHEYCVRGLLIAQKAEDWYAQLLLKTDMASLLNLINEQESSLKAYIEAKDIFEKHVKGKEPALEGNEEYTLFIIDLNIAFINKRLGQFENALTSFDGIAETAKTLLDGMYLDKIHTEYASIYLSLDKFEEAKKHVDIIVDLLKHKKQTFMQIAPNNYIVLCMHLLESGIVDRTGVLLDLIKDSILAKNDPFVMRAFYHICGQYYGKIGNAEKSMENYELYAHYVEQQHIKQSESDKENVKRREELQQFADKRIEIEKSLNEGKKELTIAKKASEAKGTFMSRMSHEIRTPLNAIIGYNEIATKALSEPKNDTQRREAIMRALESLNKCSVASRHLLTVINDVLDVSAIESGKIHLSKDRFDFKEMVNSLTTVFYAQAKKKEVRLDVILCELYEEWFIGDVLRTTQILTNILSNAIKFTPEGGSVVMKIAQKQQDKTTLFHFEISDTGIGMSKEYLDKIWAPFEQADASISRRYGGTGLGMTITKTLVDLMGGKIEVESELGKGTTFNFDINLQRTEQPQLRNMYDFSTVNALVVDDDPVVCNYIAVLFERCSARCKTVTSGAEAVKAYKEAKEKNDSFSICIVDWQMSKMDGIETIKKIRKLAGKSVPMVVLSAYDYSEIADKAIKAGVDKFIAKPIFQSTLFNLLADLCGIASEGEAMARDKHYDFSGKRILLAEDNDMNMDIAKTILSSVNLDIDGVVNGQEAVNAFTNSKEGYYNLILMDVQMPIMDGHTATRTIRASAHPQAKSIPIIAMTADAFAENIAESHESGMNDHISKPFETGHLFGTIAAYLQNENKGSKK